MEKLTEKLAEFCENIKFENYKNCKRKLMFLNVNRFEI